MKKLTRILIIVLIVALCGGGAFMVLNNLMLVRLPVLVHESAKVTFVFGNAQVRTSKEGKWKQLIVGSTLKGGYDIKTETSSMVDIRFHTGMAVRVSENSLFSITKNDIKGVGVGLTKGKFYGKFEKLFKDYDIKIKTPAVIAAVRGTELGFELKEVKTKDDEKDKKKKMKKGKKIANKKDNDTKDNKNTKDTKDKPDIEKITNVYSLSGITEVLNPKFKDKKILLSYQKQMEVSDAKPVTNVDEIKKEKLKEIRSILNSIHYQVVLLISEKITFKSGSAKITKSSFKELDKIANIILDKGVKIRIEGHTDSIGDTASNQSLSNKRAEAIKSYFIKKGIKAEKLFTQGFGESKPIASNKTLKGRASNRRVEFIIVD